MIMDHNPTAEFQFTHLHEVRLLALYVRLPVRNISIHAPTRGATSAGQRAKKRILFQFTHLHEVRPITCDDVTLLDAHFNSRTYTRCDNTTL